MNNESRRLSRREALLAAGGGILAIPGLAALGGSASALGVGAGQLNVRAAGSPDVPCRIPPGKWADIGNPSHSITVVTDGRPILVSGRLHLEVGGTFGTMAEVGLAEDGQDITDVGLGWVRVDEGAFAGRVVAFETLRHVSKGRHTWTLRVRHNNAESGPLAQSVFVRTKTEDLIIAVRPV